MVLASIWVKNQIHYYNQFGTKYKDEILSSDDPSIWTKDIKINGPTFQEIKKRINEQEKYILKSFTPERQILDLGCGFGRQAFRLAKNGFEVLGVDYSEIFIETANAIFTRHNLKGTFLACSIFDFYPSKRFEQILLLDAYEHIRPTERPSLLKHIAQNLCSENAKLFVTFPSTDRFTTKQKAINAIKGFTYKITLSKLEHPYPIPNRTEFEHTCKDLFPIIDYKDNAETAFWLLSLK